MKLAIYTDARGNYTLCIDHGGSLTLLGERLEPMLLARSVKLDKRAMEAMATALRDAGIQVPSAPVARNRKAS